MVGGQQLDEKHIIKYMDNQNNIQVGGDLNTTPSDLIDHDCANINPPTGNSKMDNPSNSQRQLQRQDIQNPKLKDSMYYIPSRHNKKVYRPLYSTENPNMKTIKTFPKFVILKAIQTDITLVKCCQFTVFKEFTEKCGKPKKMWPQNDGTLVVELVSYEQYESLNKIKSLANSKITITSHPTLNVTKGVITSKQMQLYGYTNEELKKHLADQKVVDVYQIVSRINNMTIGSSTYILTFALPQLPEKVFCGYESINVRTYISKPRRCTKCQRFGHGHTKCRSTDICVRCSQPHKNINCLIDPSCANCGGPHPASDTKCIKYLFEKDILALRDSEKISFPEARRKVQNRYV